jgi:hypothetical protein
MSAHQPSTVKVQEIAGERRLRQLLFVADLLAFLGIGAVTLYIWRFWPRGHDVYSDLQQDASETYLLIWMCIAFFAALSALSRKTRAISFVLSFLLLMECLAQLYIVAITHRPYHPWASVILNRFEPNTLLGAIPHPSTFGGISHDAMHRRTTVNEGKASDAKPIYVFGGSSAYDVGVVDAKTWASDLSHLLGPHYEVQNYGVLAYSSLEAMIQSLFVFRDIKPVCAVYYEGWNDLYQAHTDDLQSDYAPLHSTGVLEALAVAYRPGKIVNNWLFLQLIDRAVQQGPGYGSSTLTSSDQPDPRLAQIYSDNIKLIAEIDRHFGVTPIFVPQILNYDFIEAHYAGWWPTISGHAVRPLMQDLNMVLSRAAKEAGAVFLDAPLNLSWQAGDFVDQGHFSAAGSAKFAQAIAPTIAATCR